MNLAVIATVFGLIFLAELPDKTALASLVLGTRYRSAYVFAGVAAAFVVHVVLAVPAGSLLLLLPHRVIQTLVAVLFAVGAVLMLRRREELLVDSGDRREGAPWPAAVSLSVMAGSHGGVMTLTRPVPVVMREGLGKVAARSFAVTANLAARYHDPVVVGGRCGARAVGRRQFGHHRRPAVAAGGAVPLDHPGRRGRDGGARGGEPSRGDHGLMSARG